jgi:amidohydrolase
VGRARDTLVPELDALADELFDLSEEGFVEHRSVAAIRSLLERHGVPSEAGIHGLPTAFRARLVDGLPADPGTAGGNAASIAILAEYDALPGIGHACGHNIIGASSLGAFLAILEATRQLGEATVPGEVVLLGTPAEEGGNGKEILAARGAFHDVDAAIMAHPFSFDSIDHPFIGRRIVDITFHGVASHASASPFQGRNALDAVALHYPAVGLLRQQLYPGDRVHANITDGGQRPNVIPETASVQYYVRSELPETLRELSDRLDDISNGIALATGTGVTITWDPQPFTLPIRHNRVLGERWAQHQRTQGRTVLDATTTPSHLAASSDFGNVSQRIPGIHPVLKISDEDVGIHTVAFADQAAGPEGKRGLHDAVYGLASVAADFLHDPNLRQSVLHEFEQSGGAIDVEGFFS